MSETQTQTDAKYGSGFTGDLTMTRKLLKLVYGLVPIIAGADKFTNLIANWTDYMPAVLGSVTPLDPTMFMYIVGIVEIVAGVIVLTRYTRYGAALVAAWLVAVAGSQLLIGNYDIAVRDLVMAVGAIALIQLSVSDRVQ
jgi:uncharacterized membrane protein YphA (DoxX/SURF4 family)